jgi:hypothetical protein
MTESMPRVDPGPDPEDTDLVEEFEPDDPADPEEPDTLDEEDDEDALTDPGEADPADVADQIIPADDGEDEDGYERES